MPRVRKTSTQTTILSNCDTLIKQVLRNHKVKDTIIRNWNLHYAALEAFFQNWNNHYNEKPPLQIPSRPSHHVQFLSKPVFIE